MVITRALLLVLAASSPIAMGAAEKAGKSAAREQLQSRMAQEAKKSAGKASAPAGTAKAPTAPTAPAPAKAKSPAGKEDGAVAHEAAKVLPKMEVRNDRITELDQQLAKQDEAIVREKRSMKSSEVDHALNDAKLARPLAIFGGDSTQFRRGVASERVELMEAEKDLMEAIAHAKTKEEKAALQKQLVQLKAMRRELDRAMR